MEERELAGGPTHNCPIKKRLQGFGTTSWVSTTTDTGIWKPEILYCDQIQPIEKKIHAIAMYTCFSSTSFSYKEYRGYGYGNPTNCESIRFQC